MQANWHVPMKNEKSPKREKRKEDCSNSKSKDRKKDYTAARRVKRGE